MSSISVSTPVVVSASTVRETLRAPRNVPIGYLRAFVTVLVVLHHALLAYHPFAPPPGASLVVEPRVWPAFPVVDPDRSMGSTLMVGFNETFFMSLMFLLSGLFVWHSVQRKGPLSFLRGRALRLGVPFAVASLLLAPLAYCPAYLQTTARATSGSFWAQWTSLGVWFSGPVWFVWVLLAFDCLAATLLVYMPRVAKRWLDFWDERPTTASRSSPRSRRVRLPYTCRWPWRSGRCTGGRSVRSPCRRAGSFTTRSISSSVWHSARSVSNAVWCEKAGRWRVGGPSGRSSRSSPS